MQPEAPLIVVLTLNVPQVQLILDALQELPAKHANPLSNLIVAQTNEQIDAIKASLESKKATTD